MLISDVPAAARFAALLLLVPQNSAAAGEHLYVGSFAAGPVVHRFALTNGIPATKPDRAYRGYGFEVAASANGTLYIAATPNGPPRVYAFDDGSAKPTRQLDIPDISKRCGSPGGTLVDAIASDPSGYLFVAIENFFSGLRSRFAQPAYEPMHRTLPPCQGIAVYAPGASGHASPVQVISIPNSTYWTGLAVDSMDDLYISNSYVEAVDEYANAVLGPTPSRVFHSKYTGYVGALAVDISGDLFVYNGGRPPSSPGWIDVFAPGANGAGRPTSRIRPPSQDSTLASMAVLRRYLYAYDAPFGGPLSIDLYHALHHGMQSPFFSLSVAGGSGSYSFLPGVAVGP